MRPINSSLFQAVTRPKAFLNSRKRKRPRPISGHYRHVRQASCAAAMVRLGFAWLMSLLYFLLLSFFRLVAFSLFLGLTYYCAFFLFQLFFVFFFFSSSSTFASFSSSSSSPSSSYSPLNCLFYFSLCDFYAVIAAAKVPVILSSHFVQRRPWLGHFFVVFRVSAPGARARCSLQ